MQKGAAQAQYVDISKAHGAAPSPEGMCDDVQVHYQWQNGQGDLLVARQDKRPTYSDLLAILRKVRQLPDDPCLPRGVASGMQCID